MNLRHVTIAAMATLAVAISGGTAASQTAKGNAAQGRAWAEGLANVKNWNGEWYLSSGADLLRPAAYIVEDGVIYVINQSTGGRKKMVENMIHVRTYRQGLGLVHEFSVTCINHLGTPRSGRTLKIDTGFRGPYNNSVAAFPTIRTSDCGITAIRREGPEFSPLPYPSV